MIIFEPTQLPPLANEKTYLSAVLDLKKAHQFRAAVSGCQTALTRWPQSLALRMGLGNSYFAFGDLANSEYVFKEAIRLHPRTGAAYNNLAHILMEQRRYPEAMEMAWKAVSLGGHIQAVHHQTLQEFETKMSQWK